MKSNPAKKTSEQCFSGETKPACQNSDPFAKIFFFTQIVTYNPRQKSWHACSLFQYLSEKFISSPPSPQFNVVYWDEFVIARFQHWRGGRGFPIAVMLLVIVSKIACQHIFVLSDPGVPRTFVGDCKYLWNLCRYLETVNGVFILSSNSKIGKILIIVPRVTTYLQGCLASKQCSASSLNCRYLNPHIKLKLKELAIQLFQ